MFYDPWIETLAQIDALPDAAQPRQVRNLAWAMVRALDRATGRVTLDHDIMARRLNVTPSGLSRVLRTLCDLQVIRSERHPEDPRKTVYFANPNLVWMGTEDQIIAAMVHWLEIDPSHDALEAAG